MRRAAILKSAKRAKLLKPARVKADGASRDDGKVRAVIRKSDPVRTWKTFA